MAANSIAFLLGDDLPAQLQAFPADGEAAGAAVGAHHAWGLVGALAAERAVRPVPVRIDRTETGGRLARLCAENPGGVTHAVPADENTRPGDHLVAIAGPPPAERADPDSEGAPKRGEVEVKRGRLTRGGRRRRTPAHVAASTRAKGSPAEALT